MTVLGFVALSLAIAPRPSSISADLFSRMRTIEWVIAILVGGLGMVIVRAAIVRFSNLPKVSVVQRHEMITVILGLLATAIAVVGGTVTKKGQPISSDFSHIGP